MFAAFGGKKKVQVDRKASLDEFAFPSNRMLLNEGSLDLGEQKLYFAMSKVSFVSVHLCSLIYWVIRHCWTCTEMEDKTKTGP